MKLHLLVLAGVLSLATFASAQTAPSQPTPQKSPESQSANRIKRPAVETGQSITGCVDQQDGHYVIRDAGSNELIKLQSSENSADDQFARFVGHQAQASGTLMSGTLTVTHIGQVADMCPIGK
jgi:hypothetical protein